MPDCMTCVHLLSGLCPDCEAEYLADPDAWGEWGRHQAGEANWAALQAEIAANAAAHPEALAVPDDDSIPF